MSKNWGPITAAYPASGRRVLLWVPPYGQTTGHRDEDGWHLHSILNKDAVPTLWMEVEDPENCYVGPLTALSDLVEACEEEFVGDVCLDASDDEPVALGVDNSGDPISSTITFGMIRRARAALTSI